MPSGITGFRAVTSSGDNSKCDGEAQTQKKNFVLSHQINHYNPENMIYNILGFLSKKFLF